MGNSLKQSREVSAGEPYHSYLINCRPKERLDVAHGRKPKEETLSPSPRQQLSQGEATIHRTLSLLQGTFPSYVPSQLPLFLLEKNLPLTCSPDLPSVWPELVRPGIAILFYVQVTHLLLEK